MMTTMMMMVMMVMVMVMSRIMVSGIGDWLGDL